MAEAVTPPNPAGGNVGGPPVGGGRGGGRGGPVDHSHPVVDSSPDPTLLTIDSIRREIAMQENLFDTQLTAVKATIEGMEKLTVERFHRVDEMMARGEDQRKEQKQDTKMAVDAALQSQIEATLKMERSISDQLASLRSNFETSIRGVQSSISDLKDRMTIIESIKQGQSEQKSEARDSQAGLYATIGLGVTLILFAITVVGFIMGGGGA